MAQDKRVFTGGMDKDSEPRLIKPGDYRDALNIRNVASSDSTSGSVENIEGNRLVPYDFTEEEINSVQIIDEGIVAEVPQEEIIYEQILIVSGRELPNTKYSFVAHSYNEEGELIQIFGTGEWEGNGNRTASAAYLYSKFGPNGTLSTGITIINKDTGESGTAHAEVDFTSTTVLDTGSTGQPLRITIIADEPNFDFDLDFTSEFSSEFNELWSSTVNEGIFGANGHLNITTNGGVYIGSELAFEVADPEEIFTGDPLPPISDDVTQWMFEVGGEEPTTGQTFDYETGAIDVFSFTEKLDETGYDVLPFFSLAGGLFDSGATYEFDAQQDSISEALTDKFSSLESPVLVPGTTNPIMISDFISSFGYGTKLDGTKSSKFRDGETTSADYFILLKKFIDRRDFDGSSGPGASISNGEYVLSGEDVAPNKLYRFPISLVKGQSYRITYNVIAIDSGLSFNFGAGRGVESEIIDSTGVGSFQFTAEVSEKGFYLKTPTTSFGVEDDIAIADIQIHELAAELSSSLKTVIQGGTAFPFSLCFGVSSEAVRLNLEEGIPPTTQIDVIDGSLVARLTNYNTSSSDFVDNSGGSGFLQDTIADLEADIHGLESQLADLIASHTNELAEVTAAAAADADAAQTSIDDLEAEVHALENSEFDIHAINSELLTAVGDNLVDVELVSDGSFDKEDDDWDIGSGVSFVKDPDQGGNYVVINNSSLYQDIDIIPGNTYNWSVKVVGSGPGSGSFDIEVGDTSVSVSGVPKVYSSTITPTGIGEGRITINGGSYNGSIDDVSLKLQSIEGLTPAELIGFYNDQIDNLYGALADINSLVSVVDGLDLVNEELSDDIDSQLSEIIDLESQIITLTADLATSEVLAAGYLEDWTNATTAYNTLVDNLNVANQTLHSDLETAGTSSASITTALNDYSFALSTTDIEVNNIFNSLTLLRDSLNEALANQEDGVTQVDVNAVQTQLDAAEALNQSLQDAIQSDYVPQMTEMLVNDSGSTFGGYIHGDFFGGFETDYDITTATGPFRAATDLAESEFEIKGGVMEFNKSGGHNFTSDNIQTTGLIDKVPDLTVGTYTLSVDIRSMSDAGDIEIKLQNFSNYLTIATLDNLTSGRNSITFSVTSDITGYYLTIRTDKEEFVLDNLSIAQFPSTFDASLYSTEELIAFSDSMYSVVQTVDVSGLEADIDVLNASNAALTSDFATLVGVIDSLSESLELLVDGSYAQSVGDLTLQVVTTGTADFELEHLNSLTYYQDLITLLNGNLVTLESQLSNVVEEEGGTHPLGFNIDNLFLPYKEENGWVHDNIDYSEPEVTWAAGGSYSQVVFTDSVGTLSYPNLTLEAGKTYRLGPIYVQWMAQQHLTVDTGEGTPSVTINSPGNNASRSEYFDVVATDLSDRIRITAGYNNPNYSSPMIRARHSPVEIPLLVEVSGNTTPTP